MWLLFLRVCSINSNMSDQKLFVLLNTSSRGENVFSVCHTDLFRLSKFFGSAINYVMGWVVTWAWSNLFQCFWHHIWGFFEVRVHLRRWGTSKNHQIYDYRLVSNVYLSTYIFNRESWRKSLLQVKMSQFLKLIPST